MTGQSEIPSSSQVKQAGSTLRKYIRGDLSDEDKVRRAIRTVDTFRAAHQYPLTKANAGLRSMVATEGCDVEVSQRLKRFSTIVDKLRREPTLALNRMQDIGGCRAVLHDVDEVRRVEARVRKNRPPVSENDYIIEPRRSGYRGVHLIVEYDARCIEIQLRTRHMHEWALTVERLASQVGQHLKGDGDHVVQHLMAVISEALTLEEAGHEVPQSVHDEIARLRVEARPYLGGEPDGG